MTIDFGSHTMTWFSRSVDMKSTQSFDPQVHTSEQCLFEFMSPEEEEDLELFESCGDKTAISGRQCQEVSPEEVVKNLACLSKEQQQELQSVFEKHKRVFDGKLGCHPTADEF